MGADTALIDGNTFPEVTMEDRKFVNMIKKDEFVPGPGSSAEIITIGEDSNDSTDISTVSNYTIDNNVTRREGSPWPSPQGVSRTNACCKVSPNDTTTCYGGMTSLPVDPDASQTTDPSQTSPSVLPSGGPDNRCLSDEEGYTYSTYQDLEQSYQGNYYTTLLEDYDDG